MKKIYTLTLISLFFSCNSSAQKKETKEGVILEKCLMHSLLPILRILPQKQHVCWHLDKNQKHLLIASLNKNSQTVHNLGFWLKTFDLSPKKGLFSTKLILNFAGLIIRKL